jgi:hypothetical protein
MAMRNALIAMAELETNPGDPEAFLFGIKGTVRITGTVTYLIAPLL